MPKDSCLHFVGFRNDDYTRAKNVFGRPDFVHRNWDQRAASEIAPTDVIVFARTKDWVRFTDNVPEVYSFDDSAHF